MRNDAKRFFKADGSPKYLRCYEIKRDPPIDRYTIVFERASCFAGKEYAGRVFYVSANDKPTHPHGGFYQHGEAWAYEFHAPGSRVPFSFLPLELREVVMNEYRELWGIE
jgi:hypothetical protein